MHYEHERLEKKDKRPRVGAQAPKEAPELNARMESYLTLRGLDYKTARHNGWYASLNAGDEHPRIVMPATNSCGLNFWQARAIDRGVEPRYQSPSVPRGDSVIQVYPLCKNWLPVLVVAEGPMDVLAAASCGIRGVALLGISPTEETLNMLTTLSMDVEIVTFFADRDELDGAILVLQRCLKRGIQMTISDPSPYRDLAAVPLKRRQQMLDMYLMHCKK